MIIKDSMVLIHLAKITVLESCCTFFKKVIIPPEVYTEIIQGESKGYIDVQIIKNLIDNKKIQINKINNKKLIKKANEFNIFKGEAEALALYWQENADFLATDDDNVRKKKMLLNIKIIGTPVILYKLFKEKIINKEKYVISLNKLRKIGWFSNAIIDKLLMEVK